MNNSGEGRGTASGEGWYYGYGTASGKEWRYPSIIQVFESHGYGIGRACGNKWVFETGIGYGDRNKFSHVSEQSFKQLLTYQDEDDDDDKNTYNGCTCEFCYGF